MKREQDGPADKCAQKRDEDYWHNEFSGRKYPLSKCDWFKISSEVCWLKKGEENPDQRLSHPRVPDSSHIYHACFTTV